MGATIRQAYLKPWPCPVSKATVRYFTLFNLPNINCSVPLCYVPSTICSTEHTRVDTRDSSLPSETKKIDT